MRDQLSPVRVGLSAGSPQALVLTPLVLVMGSRAGLSIEQIDDLTMAMEVVLRGGARDRTAGLRAEPGWLEISIGNVDGDWIEQHRAMLSVLVAGLESDAEGVILRAGA